jgi:hypothetical protein
MLSNVLLNSSRPFFLALIKEPHQCKVFCRVIDFTSLIFSQCSAVIFRKSVFFFISTCSPWRAEGHSVKLWQKNMALFPVHKNNPFQEFCNVIIGYSAMKSETYATVHMKISSSRYLIPATDKLRYCSINMAVMQERILKTNVCHCRHHTLAQGPFSPISSISS